MKLNNGKPIVATFEKDETWDEFAYKVYKLSNLYQVKVEVKWKEVGEVESDCGMSKIEVERKFSHIICSGDPICKLLEAKKSAELYYS